jgi:hypothetical protein
MEGIYATDWETTAGVGYSGHKAGYKWWVGYSSANTWVIGGSSTLVVAIDTHGRGGTYLLDSVTGIADNDDPEDAVNDKGFWQVGSAGNSPTGVLLDQSLTLWAFRDVTPAHSYFEAIQGMGAKGLIEGYPSETGGYNDFIPANPACRAQFAKMIDVDARAGGRRGHAGAGQFQ